MLIGCITGPDLETAKSQIEKANQSCDLIEPKIPLDSLKHLLKKPTYPHTEISTYHNYEETPDDLEAVLASLPPASIYKISTMANSTLDALRMLLFVKKHPNVAGMCMGPLGQITRILAPIVSTPFTFAALGLEAAPGQLQVDELLITYRFRSLTPRTKIFGLIGNPISQSPSHKTHNATFHSRHYDAVYVKLLLQEEELPAFFPLAKELGISGLSVTIPFKEKLFPYLDHLEEKAKEIGAVNTLTFDGHAITGANTDADGALDAIEEHTLVQGKRVVLLGAGGSAKAIECEAKRRGALLSVHSRRFKNLDQIPPHDILINTTPALCPISLNALCSNTIVMDINFSRQGSPLIQRAIQLGCIPILGEAMFVRQAEGQFSRWFSIENQAGFC